ncbi:putative silent information regulator 2 [Trypanosoma theileri]|uniref:NAD-dependent protein deacetylase n=1 Tax=Trypanosoma theileri TaxID=67003 RepID=A0A1X0NT02_9TRYP|nr:putative silent information regulator 2 [Trypanosoma theileri]ORC87668.1 putative silent information regulator 2 [Trypanosoma theileri]
MQDNTNSPHVIGEPTLEGLANYIKRNNVTKILVMAGAGISVAAGIPDFRSPQSGIYANLGKYNLSSPTDAFSLPLLRERPEVFYSIVRELDLWPGHFWPTAVHYFIKLLADEGRLLLCCTQNIDGLERVCGIPESLLVEAHGSFSSASCIDCHTEYDLAAATREARGGNVPHCAKCGGVVKPDVVFFGEGLPDTFLHALRSVEEAELLLIMGTSLQVHPFAQLALGVRHNVPRVLFNLERVGGSMFRFPSDVPNPADGSVDGTAQSMSCRSNSNSSSRSSSSDGYSQYAHRITHSEGICRDVFFPGDCQITVRGLAKAMGLGERLESIIREGEQKRRSLTEE